MLEVRTVNPLRPVHFSYEEEYVYANDEGE